MTHMVTVFAGAMPVHYGFIYLSSDGDVGDELIEARIGQANGLCGARIGGSLSLITGLHTGKVSLEVEWLESEPPVDAAWDDIVEASFEITQSAMVLSAFEDFYPIVIPAKGTHRARYSVKQMDAGHELDTTDDGALAPDAYFLQLWPHAPAADAVIKQTSSIAAYWHSVARGNN